MRVDPASGDDSWSFGVPLCLASGTASAELEGVRPVAIDGAGFRYLGSAIRSFTWSAVDTPIVSIGGWPPPPAIVADKLSEVDGYGVSTPCQGVVESPQYTELLLGFQRVGSDGGGWAGIYVDYSVDEQQNALQIDHDVMICGTNVSCEPENSG
jgi:hypothetical protein